MSGLEFHINDAGAAAILKSPSVARLVNAAAQKIADGVREQKIQVGGFAGQSGTMDIPVTVEIGITDRVRATVALAHPAGVAAQAKYGALTKAASAAGLQVDAES